MRASRGSQTTWSKGCTPLVVKWRRIPIPVRSGAMDIRFWLPMGFITAGFDPSRAGGARAQHLVVGPLPAPLPPQGVRALQHCNYTPVNGREQPVWPPVANRQDADGRGAIQGQVSGSSTQ